MIRDGILHLFTELYQPYQVNKPIHVNGLILTEQLQLHQSTQGRQAGPYILKKRLELYGSLQGCADYRSQGQSLK
jgi:hypothetical protein